MTELLRISIPGGHGEMWAEEEQDGKVVVHRKASRGGVHNVIDTYDHIDRDGKSTLSPMTKEIAIAALKKVADGTPYASAFIVSEGAPEVDSITEEKSDAERTYTSVGNKFWRHPDQMNSYRRGGSSTVISTHISPEGSCNLRCPYCSVTYRDTHSRIAPEIIKQYLRDLVSRGLKAVIFTGGGEPTLYPQFNAIIQWAKYEMHLSVALITNGTQANRVEQKTWKSFSWVRVSLNVFDGWEQRISIPAHLLGDDCIVGCSMVYTSEHQATKERFANRLEILRKASGIADKIGAKYVRVLPNCLLEQKNLLLQHRALDQDLAELGDARFFHQHKVHGTPQAHVCHQAFFRPYLSEEKFLENGQPGTVYPCDSLVLNESNQKFASEYQICHATQVLDFLDGKIPMRFDPTKLCTGCVFTNNVNMLGDWKDGRVDRFKEHQDTIRHEEFV